MGTNSGESFKSIEVLRIVVMSNEPIVAVEVQEQKFGEKVVLDSPFDSKDFLKVLPWKEMQEEVEEHGSLREKAVSRGMSNDNVAIDAAEDFGFSDDLATHVSWDSSALGPDSGAWTVDVESFEEVAEFLEFAGFPVEVKPGVEV